MSDASPPRNDDRARYLRPEEKALIKTALGSSIAPNLDKLKVVDADDGGMGGVRFQTGSSTGRVFGSELARLTYVDVDGIPVSITLNLDSDGNLFELDFWKIDFSPLLTYPEGQRLGRDDP